jgi:hypothetical protein
MLRAHLLAFSLGLPLLSCASGNRPMRLVDCTQGDYCGVLHETPDSSWSPKHEALYWRGVRSILQEMACGPMGNRGRKLAYVAAEDLSVSCSSGSARARRVRTRDDGDKLLGAGQVDYVVEFDRANPSMLRGGTEVPISASYYGRAGRDSRLEGVDTYLVVQTDTLAEVRLVSRAAL